MALVPFNEVINFTRGTGATRINAAGLIVGVDFSSTSNTITTGSKTFTLTADANVNRDWPVGSSVRAVDQVGGGVMMGTVTSYTPSTQALVIEVTSITGSGTSTNWRIGSLEVRRDSNGVLQEGQASNLFNGNFNATAVTVTAGGVSPSGSASTRLQGTGATSVYSRSHGVQTGLTLTVSYYVRARTPGANDKFRLFFSGAVASADFTATSEWQRFTFTGTASSSSIGGISRPANNADWDVEVFGDQVEIGDNASSLIPTTTVAVTRAADSLTATATTLAALRQGEGTLVVTAVNPDNGINQKRALRLTGANGEIRIGKQGVGTTANFTKMAEGAGLRLMGVGGTAGRSIRNDGLESAEVLARAFVGGVTFPVAINAAAFDNVNKFGLAAFQTEEGVLLGGDIYNAFGVGGGAINGGTWTGSSFIFSRGSAFQVVKSIDGVSHRIISTPIITQPTTEVTSGLVGGTNRVVIVGNGGFIATSDDNGETWTARTSGAGGNLVSVTFNGTNQFLTVSSNASTRISSDGITWTAGGTVPFTPSDVHFANGVYVVVGGQGGAQRIATSADNGASWTLRFSGAAGDLLGVTYSPNLNLWVAVGGNGGIVTATDPTGTWAVQTSGTTQTLNEVGIFNNAIYVVGAAQTLLTSTNGTSYTSLTAGVTGGLGGIAASPTTLLITGSGGAMSSSTDGTTFTSRTNNNQTLNGIAFGADRFVSVGNAANGSGYIATIDADGTVTRRVSGTTNGVGNIKFGANAYYAVAGIQIGRSADGVSWSFGNLGGSNHVSLAIDQANNRVYYLRQQSLINITDLNNTFVANTNVQFTPTSGDIEAANGVVIIVGNGGNISRSTNAGQTWTLVPSGTTQNLTSVMYSIRDSRWYAAGNAGTLLFSEDNGVTWQSAQNAGLGAINAAGTSQVNALLPQWQTGTNKIAISYKASDVKVSINGSVPYTDTSALIPTVDSIIFGDTFNGYITRIKHVNEVLDVQTESTL